MESGILYSVLQARGIAVGQEYLIMLRVSDEKSVEGEASIYVILWVDWN